MSELDVAQRIAERELGQVESVEFIDAGWSTDRKYLVSGRFLLRLSDPEHTDQRRFEFEAIATLRTAGVLCPEPIRFGIEEGHCFGLYTYIPGECAETALPKLTPTERHTIGSNAGDQLLKIHSALKPDGNTDEYSSRGGKFRKHSSMLAASGVTFRGQELTAHFVESKIHLLKDRPTCFRHGDFHPGNLIIDGPFLAGVIDFNRCDFGDPFDDFYKTAYFGAPVSEDYARGLIYGYFEGAPPAEFWPIYNVYVAAVLPSDIVWAQQLFPDRVQEAICRVERITSTHDFKDGGPPNWWS